jgi:hypothetical protein
VPDARTRSPQACRRPADEIRKQRDLRRQRGQADPELRAPEILPALDLRRAEEVLGARGRRLDQLIGGRRHQPREQCRYHGRCHHGRDPGATRR